MQREDDMEKRELSILSLLALTLLPSAAATALYVAAGFLWQGIPALALFLVVVMLSLFPFEAWLVMSENKKAYGVYGFRIVLSNQRKMGWWRILFYGLGLFGFAGLMSVTVQPLENWLMGGLSGKISAALPAYFDWNHLELIKSYPKGILIFTGVFYLVSNGIVYPLIEEIYFRGYLTNRLQRYGMLAPMIVSVVFSFYHWWLPFNNLFRICVFSVAASVVYKKKNIYISMVFHCLCNLFSSVFYVAALLN